MDDESLRKTHDEVQRYAQRRLGDEAEDVAQEVMARLASNQDRVTQGDEGRWCGTVARNVVIDFARRRIKRAVPVSELPVQVDVDASPERIAVRRSDVALALEALADLPEDQAELLWEHLVNERSRAELAAEAGISMAAMHKRVSRSEAALRESFVRRGGTVATLLLVFPILKKTGLLRWTTPSAVVAVAAALSAPMMTMPLYHGQDLRLERPLATAPVSGLATAAALGGREEIQRPAVMATPVPVIASSVRLIQTNSTALPPGPSDLPVQVTVEDQRACAVDRPKQYGLCAGRNAPLEDPDYVGVKPWEENCSVAGELGCSEPGVSGNAPPFGTLDFCAPPGATLVLNCTDPRTAKE